MTCHIVIVGASLVGLSAAETVRAEGFRGRITEWEVVRDPETISCQCGLTSEPPSVSDSDRTTSDRDILLENLAAELTGAVYLLALGRGLEGSWIELELGLWKALVETVKEWARQRPPASSAVELGAWQKGLLGALTGSALSIALNNRVEGTHRELESGVRGAFRQFIER